MKRLIPLILALVVLMSVFAVAVYADSVDPRAYVCSCGGYGEYKVADVRTSDWGKCNVYTGAKHVLVEEYSAWICNDCGAYLSSTTMTDSYVMCEYTMMEATH